MWQRRVRINMRTYFKPGILAILDSLQHLLNVVLCISTTLFLPCDINPVSVNGSSYVFTFSAADLLKIHNCLGSSFECERAVDLLKEKYADHARFLESYVPEYMTDVKANWNRAVRPSGMPADNNGLEAHNRKIKKVFAFFLEFIISSERDLSLLRT